MEQMVKAVNIPTAAVIITISFAIYAIIQWITEVVQQHNISKEIKDIEKEVFLEQPEISDDKIQQLSNFHGDIKKQGKIIAGFMKESGPAISKNRLSNMYSKHIERCQRETRSRARWSFAFAVVSMTAGFIFVMKGGAILLTATENIVLVSGTLFSTIGAAISGYIAKTFLDIHKISLQQLSEYFQQPVLNDHILTAQRIADESNDPEIRKKAYEKIIESITKLIDQRTLDTEKR